MGKRGRPSKKIVESVSENMEVVAEHSQEEVQEVVKEKVEQENTTIQEEIKPVEETTKEEIKEPVKEEKQEVVKPAEHKEEKKPVVIKQNFVNTEVVAQNAQHGWVTVIPKYSVINVVADYGQVCAIMYQGRKYNIAKCYISH
jgi:hypothetical protein